MDPSEEERYQSFINEVKHGSLEVVKRLLQDPRIDPSDYDNYAIQIASANGNSAVVKILLQDPRVNPSARDNWAIQIASSYGRVAVVTLLLQDPRVDVHKLNPIELLTIKIIISMNLVLPFPTYSKIKHFESAVREQRQEFIDIIDERTVYNNTDTHGIHREVWKYVVSPYLE
jgi:ankyrin repeat protein